MPISFSSCFSDDRFKCKLVEFFLNYGLYFLLLNELPVFMSTHNGGYDSQYNNQYSNQAASSETKNPVENHQQRAPEVNSLVARFEQEIKVRDEQLAALRKRNEELMSSSFAGGPSDCYTLSWPVEEDDTQNYPRVQKAAQPTTPIVTDFITAQIPIRANGYLCAALVDTGASITIASQEVCKFLGIPSLQAYKMRKAVGLGGITVEMAGSAVIEFKIGSNKIQHRVHFTVGSCTPPGASGYDFILGNDLL
ncbi:hypothetical protein CRE_25640 [Caenorhabditis remanei]|uniref:Peptidase A2 domain-containing protein n=2 Tax=Caenorhabditis remanei TaxID=31234 RepID=E3ML63_CAERE|nr:hypothetical protein CRE_25640 [Caenorhabditis remanei]